MQICVLVDAIANVFRLRGAGVKTVRAVCGSADCTPHTPSLIPSARLLLLMLYSYFETFLLVHNKSGRAVASVSQPLGGSNTGTGSSGSSSPAPPGSASASAGGLGRPLLSVDYSEFLLFLFIQKYRHWQYVFRRRRSAAAALAAASSKTPKPDMKKSDTEEEREMVLEFVIQHLPTLIRLARDPQKQLSTSCVLAEWFCVGANKYCV